MSVIERIEKGELMLVEYVPCTSIRIVNSESNVVAKPKWLDCLDETNQLLQYAKLGQAALEAVELTVDTPCAKDDARKCNETHCVWLNFCKLRKEISI